MMMVTKYIMSNQFLYVNIYFFIVRFISCLPLHTADLQNYQSPCHKLKKANVHTIFNSLCEHLDFSLCNIIRNVDLIHKKSTWHNGPNSNLCRIKHSAEYTGMLRGLCFEMFSAPQDHTDFILIKKVLYFST